MLRTLFAGLLIPALVALAAPALAHHAVQSEFDMNGKSQTWTGTLKERSAFPRAA